MRVALNVIRATHKDIDTCADDYEAIGEALVIRGSGRAGEGGGLQSLCHDR